MAELIALEALFERIPAPKKLFKEVVVFVHHYGGSKFSYKKHVEFINSLGFDVVTFDLPFNHLKAWLNRPPISRSWKIGLRHVWAEKLETVLGSLPEKKFVFSFSSPSSAALMAIARRHAVDISGWICDGGPFSDLTKAIDNLIREDGLAELKVSLAQHPQIRKRLAYLLAVATGLRNYQADMTDALGSLYDQFPILSVRGNKDRLVETYMIDDFFNWSSRELNLTKLDLPNTTHLTGMNLDPELYKVTLKNFLENYGTHVSEPKNMNLNP